MDSIDIDTWTCRRCGSTDLLSSTHRFCPNCGAPSTTEHLSYERPTGPTTPVAHRFHATAAAPRQHDCCDQTWATLARFCGVCGTRLAPPPSLAEQPTDVKIDRSPSQQFAVDDLARFDIQADTLAALFGVDPLQATPVSSSLMARESSPSYTPTPYVSLLDNEILEEEVVVEETIRIATPPGSPDRNPDAPQGLSLSDITSLTRRQRHYPPDRSPRHSQIMTEPILAPRSSGPLEEAEICAEPATPIRQSPARVAICVPGARAVERPSQPLLVRFFTRILWRV